MNAHPYEDIACLPTNYLEMFRSCWAGRVLIVTELLLIISPVSSQSSLKASQTSTLEATVVSCIFSPASAFSADLAVILTIAHVANDESDGRTYLREKWQKKTRA